MSANRQLIRGISSACIIGCTVADVTSQDIFWQCVPESQEHILNIMQALLAEGVD